MIRAKHLNPVALGDDPSGMITCNGWFSWVPGCGVATDIQNYLAEQIRDSCGSAGEVVPLRLLHSEDTLARGSLDYWSRQSTQSIIESLAPGSPGSLVVKANGTIMDGNTRIFVLMQRGYGVDSLPRELYQSFPPMWDEELP
jgi:hypothetical protein